jgi:hypothetical protein
MRSKGIAVSNHSKALVPIESWCFGSPELKLAGRTIDVGLFAEALVYYPTVLLNIATQAHLADLVLWLRNQYALDNFIALMREGSVIFYDYSFMTAPILKDGAYSLWNLQDPIQEKENSWPERYLKHKEMRHVFESAKERKMFNRCARQSVVEAKSANFGPAIEEARRDLVTARRSSLVLQSFVDELYRVKAIDNPPKISAKVHASADGSQRQIQWNVDFKAIGRVAGAELNFHNGTPLAGAAVGNRLLWTASDYECDLFLPRPMATVVGDKLEEAVGKVAKTKLTIEELQEEVEFPDIRNLVNEGKLTFADVLRIRNKADKFRFWLQSEADRDRNAIIAYHNEVAKESGVAGAGKKALNLFGILGGGALAAAAGAEYDGAFGGAIGAGATVGVTYLVGLATKLGSKWRPVVFGEWLGSEIKKISNVNADEE